MEEIDNSKEAKSIALTFILTQLKEIAVKMRCPDIEFTKSETFVEELVDGINSQVKHIVDNLLKMVQSMNTLEKPIPDMHFDSAEEIKKRREK